MVLQESMKHRLKFAYHLKADIIKEGKRSLRQNAADLKVRSEYKAMINAVNWRKQDLTTGAERVFSNDDFMAYKNPYVQFKMNEKDKAARLYISQLFSEELLGTNNRQNHNNGTPVAATTGEAAGTDSDRNMVDEINDDEGKHDSPMLPVKEMEEKIRQERSA